MSPDRIDPTPSVPLRKVVGCGMLLMLVLLASMPVIQTLEFGSRSAGERLATDMAKPLGLLWSTLWVALGTAWFTWFRLKSYWSINPSREDQPLFSSKRNLPVLVRLRWPLLVGWLFITFFGNKHLSRWAWTSVEFPYAPVAADVTFDSVVLLGGGIGTGPDLSAKLAEDGDRIRPVLQLWHSGRVKQIYVTGSSTLPSLPDPSEFTAELLQSLGVPGGVIVRVPGVNTSEEMAALKMIWHAEGSNERSDALVTSAFHMRRALRLAEAEGLTFYPIPAAYRSDGGSRQRTPIGFAASLVPTAQSMEDIGRIQKEWMAALIGR